MGNILLKIIVMAGGTLLAFLIIYEPNIIDLLDKEKNLQLAQTMAFTTMAMFQVFNAANLRSVKLSIFKKGLFSNKYFLGTFFLSIIIQIIANLFFGVFLGVTRLDIYQWLIVIAITISIFFVDELRKFIYNKIEQKRNPQIKCVN